MRHPPRHRLALRVALWLARLTVVVTLLWQGALIEVFVDHTPSAECEDDDHGGPCQCPDGCHGCLAGAHHQAPSLPPFVAALVGRFEQAALIAGPLRDASPPSPDLQRPVKVPKLAA